MTAQDIIKRLHKYYWLSDKEIAHVCGVSREHINRVKNGKLRPEHGHLQENLEQLLTYCQQNHIPRYRKHYERKAKPIARKPTPVPARIAAPVPQTSAPVFLASQAPTLPALVIPEPEPAPAFPKKQWKPKFSHPRCCYVCEQMRDGVRRYKAIGNYSVCPDCAAIYVPGFAPAPEPERAPRPPAILANLTGVYGDPYS